MSESFQFHALPAETFAPLFDRTDAELAAMGARRQIVDGKPGYPCRVSLEDAEVGETVLLLPYTHHDVDSPYRASGPIYVRRGVATADPAVGEIPAPAPAPAAVAAGLRRDGHDGGVPRSSRAPGSRRRSSACSPTRASATCDVHNAQPGCFNCRVTRASRPAPGGGGL